jgi:hypothetical protein
MKEDRSDWLVHHLLFSISAAAAASIRASLLNINLIKS